MKIAVFGASGFVGSAVVDAINSRGHTPLPIASPRTESVITSRLADAIKAVAADPDVVAALKSGQVEAAVIATGHPDASSTDEGALNAANVLSPLISALSCREAGVKRVIYVSSAVVQGDKPVLDSSDEVRPFSPYSHSKVAGEQAIAAVTGIDTVVFRPPSVHAASRRVTQQVAKIGRSQLRSIAGKPLPSPQALITNVADALAFLATYPETPPATVHYPSEGLTTRDIQFYLSGGKEPRRIPRWLAKALVGTAKTIGHLGLKPFQANARRLEVIWLGQGQASSWFEIVDWTIPASRAAWRKLAPSPPTDTPSATGAMSVLVVSQYAYPERVPIVPGIAPALAQRGHHVRLLTAFPNYPEGRLYDGYHQRWRLEEQDRGVTVTRVPIFIDHSQSGLKRMINYLSFALSSTFARSTVKDCQVIYVYATQLTAAMGPWLWSFLPKAKPYTLHIQDLWPDSVTGSDMISSGTGSRMIEGLLNPWIKSVYKRASQVIAISPSMADVLNARGIPREKLRVLYNWSEITRPSDATAPTSEHSSRSAGDKLRLIYAGNMGTMQDLKSVINAVGRSGHLPVELTLIGSGVLRSELEDLVRSAQYDNIQFLDARPADEMADVYAQADMGVVSLKDIPLFRHTIPSKFQTYCAFGLPVISTVAGEVNRIIKEREIGFASSPEDETGLLQAIAQAAALDQNVLQAMSKRARDTYSDIFAFDGAIDELESLLRQE